jgi:ABC-type polysaccharide/polyol phosphate transport system ATPase subunit
MTNDVVIRSEGLGKKYIIGHESQNERYVALRDVLARSARSLWRKTADMAKGRPVVAGDTIEEFWALKDVSFEVKRGEVLGIIGRNGAGKSTLLKVLSRITEPTEGRVTIEGRVASLLEVGTGFHPELTGRENIYLNGAILGMARSEIKRKFDEIVAFAEIERFLDTPVKRFSSGMYVRLAFAVAAHLEPEILIVDEVLAVGDFEFQKKCLGKMGEVAGRGRTVLFVSHNLPAISSLCTKAIRLELGKVAGEGDPAQMISSYLGSRGGGTVARGRRFDVSVEIKKCKLGSGPAISLRFDVTIRGPLEAPRFVIGINNSEGSRIATIFSETCNRLPRVKDGQSLQFQIETEPSRFSPGFLLVKLALADNGPDIETIEDAFRLVVPDYNPFSRPPHSWPTGPILLKSSVTVNKLQDRFATTHRG